MIHGFSQPLQTGAQSPVRLCGVLFKGEATALETCCQMHQPLLQLLPLSAMGQLLDSVAQLRKDNGGYPQPSVVRG